MVQQTNPNSRFSCEQLLAAVLFAFIAGGLMGIWVFTVWQERQMM